MAEAPNPQATEPELATMADVLAAIKGLQQRSAPTTESEAADLGHVFADLRAEVAAMREELRQQRPQARTYEIPSESPEERQARRLTEIAAHSHYCPACGSLYDYPQRCEGPKAAGHPPVEVVSTEELSGDPANHTKAPASIT